MYYRGKLSRLSRHDYLLELILLVNIFIIIYICNTYYEYTGNQFILKDDSHSDKSCPLYPSTLQGNNYMSECKQKRKTATEFQFQVINKM